MASVIRYKSGKRAVQFMFNGRRRTIGVGKMEKRDAAAHGRQIDKLVLSHKGGTLKGDTFEWLDSIKGSEIESKLIEYGVLHSGDATIRDWLVTFNKNRGRVKPQTRLLDSQIQSLLIEKFGADRRVSTINQGDADAFKAWLEEKELADSTIRRRIGRCKQIFAAAIRSEIITKNPFTHIPSAVKANRKRFYFVSREDYAAMLTACPDQDWRTIMALCRIGGLRCPSEVLRLTWDDVDWTPGRERLRVRSVKTEHHSGGDERLLPLFPELAVELRKSFDQAAEGTFRIITRYKPDAKNLRTQANRIIRKAGLIPWPKTFVNMRSSRDIELHADYPSHVCEAWIGHTEKIAAEFYLRVTEGDYNKAVQGAAKPLSPRGANDGISGSGAQTEPRQDAGNAVSREDMHGPPGRTPRVGLEPTT